MAGSLSEYFNREPRICTLATTSRKGRVNVAVFESPHMPDEKTVVMGIGRNRTFANLLEVPNAAFMVVRPAKEVVNWKGVRVYARLQDVETEGPTLKTLKDEATVMAGEMAARVLYAALRFRIVEARPLIDLRQMPGMSV
jgi:predicted mannosyl-3-phosphoglycerate phosphatase (HAD superfamily)